jgi:lipoprotein Spr
MTKTGEAVAARARGLVGVRFRPQGRSAQTGLDCIGVVALAVRAKGVRRDYGLRGGSAEEVTEGLKAAGMRPVKKASAGDVLVMKVGPEQLHLAIVTADGFVHADAGARAVVERPGQPDWPVLGIWRKRARG